MKNLWSPWRMSYILDPQKKEKGCIFEAAGDCRFDKESLTLYRDTTVVVVLNRYPYANGHLLIAPARHVEDLEHLSPEELPAIMDMLRDSIRILRNTLKPDGVNAGLNLGRTAGAGIPDHLHFHVVPRWEGDHNFMTILAEIRTIPEHINNTFDLLMPLFQTLAR